MIELGQLEAQQQDFAAKNVSKEVPPFDHPIGR